MMLLWASAGVPLGVYNIVKEFNVALQVQAQILTTLSLITWAQCYYYGKGWQLAKCIGVVLCLGTFLGGLEAGLVFALQIALARGTVWPATFMAVLAATLLALGVLRHYWDIWQQRTVRGISFIFVAIDAAGDLFSLLSIREPLPLVPSLNVISRFFKRFKMVLMSLAWQYTGRSLSYGLVS